MIYEFKWCRRDSVQFYWEVVGHLYCTLDGVVPEAGREECGVEPTSCHAYDGAPVSFHEAVLMLMAWWGGFDDGA